MNIYTYILGELQANCYLLTKDEYCILIDPADDANFLLEEIQKRNIKLAGMLATHGHFDHVSAVGEIQLSFSVPLYFSQKDMFLIKRLGVTAKYFLGYEPYIISPSLIENITGGSFEISNFKFKIIPTPGHTPGGLSFYFPEEQVVFTGDTLFKESVGRTDLSYSNRKDLEKSLKALYELPETTIIYPGHGEETSVLNEINRL